MLERNNNEIIMSCIKKCHRLNRALCRLYQNKDYLCCNKGNLRDLIAATGLVILLKLDSNHRFFSPCDFEI